VFTVDDNNDDVPGGSADYATLTAALDAVMDGDTILVYPGTYTGNHVIDHAVTVTGNGTPVLVGLTEDALDEAGDVVAIAADDVVFEGFAIREGYWTNSTNPLRTSIAALGARPAPDNLGDLSRFPLNDYFRDTRANGLLEKTGSDSYARRWHYQDAVDYTWEPFGDYFDIRVVVNGEFSRDATVKAVKL
jgi:hypothetical protein